ncbi:hypothetical protein KCP74_04895 [Salmonella enterica subsp. enterica]|nr:hypothetical protein KCP74_04895 [Salmonella enterica subsp. enterica]
MADKNISRCMSAWKSVAENLAKKNFNPAFRQQFHVGAGVLSSAATSETGMPYIRSITTSCSGYSNRSTLRDMAAWDYFQNCGVTESRWPIPADSAHRSAFSHTTHYFRRAQTTPIQKQAWYPASVC